MKRRAKIVATLGPSSAEPAVLRRLLRAGANVIRLNLSHGDHGWHREAIGRVRRIAAEEDLHVALLLDLMGPRYRLGEVSPQTLKAGRRLTLGDPELAVDLAVDPPELATHLKTGERVLINDGRIELKVVSRRGRRATARVVTGGPVSARKGINLPDSNLPFTISAKDRADLGLAVEMEADYVAASYVGRARDLAALRQALADAGGEIQLVAKLERARAVDHLEEIVIASDAVMVARGDLGVEVPLHRVPVLQKEIVRTGRRHGKPVVVATQMLESMVEQPRPTRAEASDVANAVLDGADAVMLSGETAVGRHPVDAVRVMAHIVREAEAHRRATAPEAQIATLARRDLRRLGADTGRRGESCAAPLEIADLVAASAVFATGQTRVRQIVAFSQGGFTARAIARYRPRAPIVMFSPDAAVARRIQLVWGVQPHRLDVEAHDHEEVVRLVDRELAAAGLARPGETVIILMGHPIRARPLTNLMRLHRVRSV